MIATLRRLIEYPAIFGKCRARLAQRDVVGKARQGDPDTGSSLTSLYGGAKARLPASIAALGEHRPKPIRFTIARVFLVGRQATARRAAH